MELPKPFRWNLQRREQLGRLVVDDEVEEARLFEWLLPMQPELRTCCAQILSQCRDSALVFVGRSPELLFDYLSGLFEDTDWSTRLTLLPMSIRGRTTAEIRAEFPPSALAGMRQVLTDADLSPQAIITGKTRNALVDVIYSGRTMRSVCDFLCTWAQEEKRDVPALRRKLGIVGLTVRGKTSPNTWRWQQHAPWLEDYPGDFVKNVSVPWHLWDFLGNSNYKVTHSYHPNRWGTEDGAHPSRAKAQLAALNLSWRIYQLGRSTEERRAFGRVMAGEVGTQYRWYRTLAAQLTR